MTEDKIPSRKGRYRGEYGRSYREAGFGWLNTYADPSPLKHTREKGLMIHAQTGNVYKA